MCSWRGGFGGGDVVKGRIFSPSPSFPFTALKKLLRVHGRICIAGVLALSVLYLQRKYEARRWLRWFAE